MPPPDTLLRQQELIAQIRRRRAAKVIRRYWERDRPIEMKPVMLKHYTSREKLEPRQNIWIRTTGPVPDDRAIRAAVLAYLSDMTLLDTSTFAHGRAIFDPDIQAASLDHAMWFHRDASARRLAALHAGQSLHARLARLHARRPLCARTGRSSPRSRRKG